MKIAINKHDITSPAFEKGDKRLVRFICSYLVLQALNNMLYSVNLNGTVWNYASKGLLGILSLFAWLVIVKRNGISSFLFELVVSLLLLYSYFFCSVPANFGSIVFNLLLVYIPMGLAYRCIRNTSIVIDSLYFTAWLIELLCICNALFFFSSSYSMSIGYYLLLPLLIRLDRIFISIKWYDLLLLIVDFTVIVAVASRGPLLCVFFFISIRVLFSNDIAPKKRAFFAVIIVGLSITFYLNYITIAEAIIRLFEKRGIESRTIRLLLSGSINYDAGRISIRNHYLEMIRQSPLIGYGLAGSWEYSTYPHNIVIEILLAFGIPVGLVVLIIICAIVIQGLFEKERKKRRITQIFISELISLFWSGSFIMSSTFFVGLASCLKSKESDLDSFPRINYENKAGEKKE